MKRKIGLMAVAAVACIAVALLISGAGALPGIADNGFIGKKIGKMNPDVKDCMKDRVTECRDAIDLNEPGAFKELKNCTRGALKECRDDANLTGKFPEIRDDMKNCMAGVKEECRESIDLNEPGAFKELKNCTGEGFEQCREDLNLTCNSEILEDMKSCMGDVKDECRDSIDLNEPGAFKVLHSCTREGFKKCADDLNLKENLKDNPGCAIELGKQKIKQHVKHKFLGHRVMKGMMGQQGAGFKEGLE